MGFSIRLSVEAIPSTWLGATHTLEDSQCDSDFPICYRASPLFLCTSHNSPGTMLDLSWDLRTRL